MPSIAGSTATTALHLEAQSTEATMEALAAVSLANSVAQFLDFGWKIVRGTKEVAEAGSLVSVDHLSQSSKELKAISSTVARHLETLGSGALSLEEKSLCDLARKCLEITVDIDKGFDGLIIVANSSKSRRWSSFKAAFKTIWSRDRIEELSKKLVDYRSQLTLRLLLILNMRIPLPTRATSGPEPADALKSEIIEAISVNCHNLRGELNE